MNRTFTLLSTLLFFVAALVLRWSPNNPAAANDKVAADAYVPVETNMHDFMEGVFQGPYRRLKTAIAAEPTDKAGWKSIRGEALILAEGGNLLLVRKPAKDAELWTELSVATRLQGAELYQAAKKKDFAGARTAYETMLTKCNACHTHFDGGKNQLTP